MHPVKVVPPHSDESPPHHIPNGQRTLETKLEKHPVNNNLGAKGLRWYLLFALRQVPCPWAVNFGIRHYSAELERVTLK